MLNGIKGKLNDDIMIVTGVTGGEIVSWFYPLLICSDFRYIIISIESLDGTPCIHFGGKLVPLPSEAKNRLCARLCRGTGSAVILWMYDRLR